MDRLLTSSPTLALRWMTSIARRLDEDRRRLVVVTSKPLIAQVAYLLRAAGGPRRWATDRPAQPQHARPAARRARRPSVTRVLGELPDRELILSHYGATVLPDPGGLRVIMGSEPLP